MCPIGLIGFAASVQSTSQSETYMLTAISPFPAGVAGSALRDEDGSFDYDVALTPSPQRPQQQGWAGFPAQQSHLMAAGLQQQRKQLSPTLAHKPLQHRGLPPQAQLPPPGCQQQQWQQPGWHGPPSMRPRGGPPQGFSAFPQQQQQYRLPQQQQQQWQHTPPLQQQQRPPPQWQQQQQQCVPQHLQMQVLQRQIPPQPPTRQQLLPPPSPRLPPASPQPPPMPPFSALDPDLAHQAAGHNDEDWLTSSSGRRVRLTDRPHGNFKMPRLEGQTRVGGSLGAQLRQRKQQQAQDGAVAPVADSSVEEAAKQQQHAQPAAGTQGRRVIIRPRQITDEEKAERMRRLMADLAGNDPLGESSSSSRGLPAQAPVFAMSAAAVPMGAVAQRQQASAELAPVAAAAVQPQQGVVPTEPALVPTKAARQPDEVMQVAAVAAKNEQEKMQQQEMQQDDALPAHLAAVPAGVFVTAGKAQRPIGGSGGRSNPRLAALLADLADIASGESSSKGLPPAPAAEPAAAAAEGSTPSNSFLLSSDIISQATATFLAAAEASRVPMTTTTQQEKKEAEAAEGGQGEAPMAPSSGDKRRWVAEEGEGGELVREPGSNHRKRARASPPPQPPEMERGSVAMPGWTTGGGARVAVTAANLRAAQRLLGGGESESPEGPALQEPWPGAGAPEPERASLAVLSTAAAGQTLTAAPTAEGKVQMLGFSTGRFGTEQVSAAALRGAMALFGEALPLDLEAEEGAGVAAGEDGEGNAQGEQLAARAAGQGASADADTPLLRRTLLRRAHTPTPAVAAQSPSSSPAAGRTPLAASPAGSEGSTAAEVAAGAACTTPATVPLAGRARGGVGPSRLGMAVLGGASGGSAATTGAAKRGRRRGFSVPRMTPSAAAAAGSRLKPGIGSAACRQQQADSAAAEPKQPLHDLQPRLASRLIAAAAEAGAELGPREQDCAVALLPLPLDSTRAADSLVADGPAPAATSAVDGAVPPEQPQHQQLQQQQVLPARVGWAELRQRMLAAGASPSHAREAWVRNHFRWAVWKLARAELAGGLELRGRLLTAEILLDELKYR